MVLGRILFTLGVVFSVLFAVLFVIAIVNPGGDNAEGAKTVVGGSIVLLGCSLIVYSIGKRRIKLYANYNLYRHVISSHRMGSPEEFALAVNQPLQEVMKNLEQMRAKKLFLDLHFTKRAAAQPSPSLSGKAISSEPAVAVTVECECCGANNTVQAGTGGICEYCGSPLKLPAHSRPTDK